MSGGHFDYIQFRLSDEAETIERLIKHNDNAEYPYSENTMKKFKEAVSVLKKASVMLHRIDWLISGDDSEDAFHLRWFEDMADI